MSAPMVPEGATIQIAPRVHVIPDQRIEFVPNAGIVVGERAALVIETAMGAANGERVLREARRLAGERPLLLTTTHFHPEHAFGAQAFVGSATYICNRAQAEELAAKGREYVEMFSGFGPALEELLRDVELVAPQVVYGDEASVDLGGIVVELRHFGTAHTRGDQVAFVAVAKRQAACADLDLTLAAGGLGARVVARRTAASLRGRGEGGGRTGHHRGGHCGRGTLATGDLLAAAGRKLAAA